LFDQGRSNVGDIARKFSLSRPAISDHLKLLKNPGVIEYEKVGQEGFYWLNRMRLVSGLRAIADRTERFQPNSPGDKTEDDHCN